MKTIAITKDTRKMIDEYSRDGETLDMTMQRLIKSNEPSPKEDRTVTNITIYEDTFKDLMRFKTYPTQSHNDTVMELLRKAL